MAARNVDDLPTSECHALPVCTGHGRSTCYQCLHSFNCDADGQPHSEPYMMTRPSRLHPLRGQDVLFIPQLDAHLGLTAGVTGRSRVPDALSAGENHGIDALEIITPPAMAPRDDWFVFCRECQLTWLSGHDGASAAIHHPSHTALRDKRTLVCWAGIRDVQSPSDTPPKTATRAGLVHFGPGSKYNTAQLLTGDTEDALFEVAKRCLKTVRISILQERRKVIGNMVHTNSIEFSERAQTFRLVVIVSYPGLVEFLQSLESFVVWGRPNNTYSTRFGKWKPKFANFKPSEHMTLRLLEIELDRLAKVGIMVRTGSKESQKRLYSILH
jgi:hypothetical protein